MKRNEGISLIVLVITIIVMIILAGAIILSLNNAGIIGKANEAVNMTNEATVRQMVELKWAEAYLDSNVEKTDVGMYNAVMDKLKNELGEQALLPYDIQVTTKGATVEKLPTVDELQETYKETFKYYSSLRKAIDDVNAGTIGTNADATKSNAKAGVYTLINENGVSETHVVLLKSCTENARLKPTVDMTINLGGNTLTFEGEEAIVGIDGTTGNTSTIIIDGRLAGSKMIIKGTNTSSRLFQTRTNTFIINGGTYEANTPLTTTSTSLYGLHVAYVSQNGYMEINNAKLVANLLLTNEPQLSQGTDGENIQVIVVQVLGNAVVNNCKIYANVSEKVAYTNAFVMGIQSVRGNLTAVNSEINVATKVSGNDVQIHGVDVDKDAKASLGHCTIVAQDTEGAKVYGIINTGELLLNECNVSATAISDVRGIGIINESKATITKSSIVGSTAMIEDTGEMYIDGEKYVSQ